MQLEGGIHAVIDPLPPFRRLLIANRGEIAVRIARTCREMGIETVAVYSDADAEARHVRAADQAVRIGPAAASESYLRADRIVESAVRCGAKAIHPGYGFLSEQAAFAEAVEAAGLVFVGPSPPTLARLGDKLAARRSAATVGVPIVPGTFEPLRPAGAVAASGAIGFPLLVKAAAGGGGRGMRRVDAAADLEAAVAAAGREAEQAFGDRDVYLERLIEGARHVEVQLLGDAHGQVVALGERDCSTQRRHQKLVEEAPAPGLSRAQREALFEAAVRVAQDVGLRNAATVEFLLAPDGGFHFLEVNARLQVEHPVTELITGLDLVREQLLVAAGAPLSPAVLAAASRALEPGRHAIELRVSAEDPGHDFLPTPGVLTRWREPGGPGVRVDAGVEEGWRVSPDYDPLLAKVIVMAPDRDAAVSRARRAIRELEVAGVQTTRPFHAWLLEHPSFLEGRLRTDLVERDWDPGPSRDVSARRAAEAAAAYARSTAARGLASTSGSQGSPAASTVTSPDAALAWRTAGLRDALERWS
jgi:acetyl/propionyl-CoA carboxylase alpha subunit